MSKWVRELTFPLPGVFHRFFFFMRLQRVEGRLPFGECRAYRGQWAQVNTSDEICTAFDDMDFTNPAFCVLALSCSPNFNAAYGAETYCENNFKREAS